MQGRVVNLAGLPLPVLEAAARAWRDSGWLNGEPDDELLEHLAPGLAVAIATWEALQEKAVECGERGHHENEIVNGPDGQPIGVACAHCGKSWGVAVNLLPAVTVDTPAVEPGLSRSRRVNAGEPHTHSGGDDPPEPQDAPEGAGDGEQGADDEPEAAEPPEEGDGDGPEGSALGVCEKCNSGQVCPEAVAAPFNASLCMKCLLTCTKCKKAIKDAGTSTKISPLEQAHMSQTRWRKRLCRTCHIAEGKT